MTRIDQITADVLAGSPETHIAILAREVARLREAPAVVVPELTDEEIDARLYASCPAGPDSDEDWARFMRRQCRWAYFLATSRARAIPANRVLGEGMVAVDREEWDAVQAFAAVWFAGRPDGEVHDASSMWHARRQALRANQGGANHD